MYQLHVHFTLGLVLHIVFSPRQWRNNLTYTHSHFCLINGIIGNLVGTGPVSEMGFCIDICNNTN
jgi:hypothetical protein